MKIQKFSKAFLFATLTFLGIESYADCVPNLVNSSASSTTLSSTSSGDCVINNSSITVSGGSYGIDLTSTSTNSSATNNGTILTSDTASVAIYSSATGTSITNTSEIETSGIGAVGIRASGLGATNTNTSEGRITTFGSNAHAIYSSGNSSSDYNSGEITTSGVGARGIYNTGSSGIVENSGIISTSGSSSAHGVQITGTSGSILNTGTISTSGSSSHGIHITSASGSIVNTGTISTTGSGYGVNLAGNNQTFTNSGLVSATGTSSYAIRWATGASNGVVNLNRGSVVIGDMTAGDHSNARLNINLGSGASYAYSVSNHILVTDLDNRPMVTGSAYAAGIGAQETASEMLYQRTSVVSSALDRRLRSYNSNYLENQPYWLDVYYSDVTRNSGGNYSTQTAFSNYNYGITAGFKLPTQLTPLELVVNVEQSNLNIDSGNQKIDSSSIMTGLLAPSITEVLGAKLSAKALLGYADHDGDRKVMTNSLLFNGSRQIKSDYKSNSALFGATLIKTFDLSDHLVADVLLGVDLTSQRVRSYRETDYFAWDSRTLTQVQSRLQFGLEGFFFNNKGSVFARVGAEHRDLIGGATQDYSINGTNVSFNTNNKNDTYLTAQIGTKIQLDKRIQLFGVVNTLSSSDTVNSISGNFGLRADF